MVKGGRVLGRAGRMAQTLIAKREKLNLPCAYETGVSV